MYVYIYVSVDLPSFFHTTCLSVNSFIRIASCAGVEGLSLRICYVLALMKDVVVEGLEEEREREREIQNLISGE